MGKTLIESVLLCGLVELLFVMLWLEHRVECARDSSVERDRPDCEVP